MYHMRRAPIKDDNRGRYYDPVMPLAIPLGVFAVVSGIATVGLLVSGRYWEAGAAGVLTAVSGKATHSCLT